MQLDRSTVYREPGRFAGWPANYGLWGWGEEVVSIFVSGWIGTDTGLHPRDRSRPFVPVVARSQDGGRSWTHEPFTGTIPGGAQTLSGDEHVDADLQIGPRLSADDFVPMAEPIDFTDPETIVLVARTGIVAGAVSWFYVSSDRARTWTGPYRIPDFGQAAVAARTDIVAFGPDEALFQLTTGKPDGSEGRVLSAWTGDGGRTFEQRGWVGETPDGYAIMPSSVALEDGTVLCARRCAGAGEKGGRATWIDLYASQDRGVSWELIGRPVPDAGGGGNPPALVRLADDRLVLAYGSRAEPYGLRAVSSDDHGRSWTLQVLTDDVAVRDMGYPRAIAMDDGTVLAAYYANSGSRSERSIEAVRWRP
ncbi:sialidase family protein [Microlunatus soli]|uniref:BNR repeat-like domain-containing protein n=1 Tax=Microlunatus soli TaxID=630515 RepID=A0A1H1QSG9_9ACTN|nr:sialidase family protein [Microlunatus soli]SDS26336.1 BNR repeat-like domain-containing protein [Microlunatus soli]